MAKIRPFGGVLVVYDSVTHRFDEPTLYGNVMTVSHLCYQHFEDYLQGDLEVDEDIRHLYRLLNKIEWDEAYPNFPVFCLICEDMLDLEPLMCCKEHRYDNWNESGRIATKTMIEMITKGGYLCPFYTLLALNTGEITERRARAIIRFGKRHIPLFGATPAGMLLYAREEV